MPNYHVLLKVITIFSLLMRNTLEFLYFKDNIEFNEIKQYRLNQQISVKLNDKSKFSMRRVFPDKESVALEIVYKMDRRTVLGKKTSKGIAWIYTDKSNPYKVLSYTLTEKTPREIRLLIQSMPTIAIKGMDNILDAMNLIEWTPDLIKKFYNKADFAVLRFASKKDFAKEMKILKDLLNYSNKFDHEYFNKATIQYSMSNSTSKACYPYFISLYIRQIFVRLFQDQLGRKGFDFDYFAEDKEDFYRYMPKDFVFSFEELDALRTLVKAETEEIGDQMEETLKRERFPSNDEIQDIFSEILKPMTETNLFPFYSLLFQKVKRTEMTKTTKTEITHMYSKFNLNTVHSKKDALIKENISDLTMDLVIEVFRMYKSSDYRYPLLADAVKSIFKRLKRRLLDPLKKFKNLDFKRAWKLYLMHEKDFFKNYVNISPNELNLARYLSDKYYSDFETFMQSDLLNRVMGPEYDPNFLKKNLYYASLLGGDFPGRPKYVNKIPVFKLKIKTRQPAMELIRI